MEERIATVKSVKLAGIDGVPVTVECLVAEEGIGIHMVGLADAQVKQSLLRTVTALQACGYRIPGKKIVINMAPADLRKEGSGYDLPIAMAILAASGQGDVPTDMGGRLLAFGELSLDGSVRPVPGCVQAVETAIKEGCKEVIIPAGNAEEIRRLSAFGDTHIRITGVCSLRQAIDAVTGKEMVTDVRETSLPVKQTDDGGIRWDEVRIGGIEKRALEIAAAGGHHLLLVGIPGSGKSTYAKLLRQILPPMTPEETLAVAKVYSAAGYQEGIAGRPYRNPHYSCSIAAILGGGAGGDIRPGEVSLASEGVLHIDEFAELPKSIYEALRAPLEDGKVTISRLRSKTEFPARFQLVASTNPCPCGYHGDGDRCTCTQKQKEAYLNRIKGPVYDYIDIQVLCRGAILRETNEPAPEGDRLQDVAERVRKAREIQHRRLGPGRLNAGMTKEELSKWCEALINETGVAPDIETMLTRMNLTERAYAHALKVTRTIADLEGSEYILPRHFAEALSFRFFDRKTA